MTKTKVTEKYDGDGKLLERITETEYEYEFWPVINPAYPVYPTGQPWTIPWPTTGNPLFWCVGAFPEGDLPLTGSAGITPMEGVTAS